MEEQSGPDSRKRSGTRLRDDELRVMAGITRALQGIEQGPRDAIVGVVMQTLTARELHALRTVLRLLATLDEATTAERTRRWVYDRFGQPTAPEAQHPTEEPWR